MLISSFDPADHFGIDILDISEIDLMRAHGIGCGDGFKFTLGFLSFEVYANFKSRFGGWLQNGKLLFPS